MLIQQKNPTKHRFERLAKKAGQIYEFTQTVQIILTTFQFGTTVVTFKSMARTLLALIKSSLFYGQMLMVSSFPGEPLNQDFNRSLRLRKC